MNTYNPSVPTERREMDMESPGTCRAASLSYKGENQQRDLSHKSRIGVILKVIL